MLKIEIIKFEAQDVITTSTPIANVITCDCTAACFNVVDNSTYVYKGTHDETCGCDPSVTNHYYPN